MRKLSVFNNVSLDGFFTDRNNDMSWAHRNDPEWLEFISNNAKGDGEFVFGRKTYEMMASFWPTPMAMKQMPDVARRMNESRKIVFSRTLKKVDWNNTHLFKGDLVGTMKELKTAKGPDMIIFGSGTIVSQLTEAGLIDGFQIVVHPLIFGSGRTMFDGVKKKCSLELTQSRVFKNGCIVLWYGRPSKNKETYAAHSQR